jgi:hypothetical protein
MTKRVDRMVEEFVGFVTKLIDSFAGLPFGTYATFGIFGCAVLLIAASCLLLVLIIVLGWRLTTF